MKMKPSNRTHFDDRRIEFSNLILTLISIVLIPLFLFMIFQNVLFIVSVEMLFLVGFVDLTLTADMLNRGYREQNFYRIFFKYFGDNRGFQVTIILNSLIRGAVCFFFYHEPTIILLCAISTFFGPFWNALHGFAFRDDIVLKVPIEVRTDTQQIEVDSGNKTRLETKKEGDE